MPGAFITFEGIDGCGKSTQLRLLASELRVRGLEVIATREPGGTTLGQRLRAALLDVEEQVDPLAELLVFAADRAQHVRSVLVPALEANHVVLLFDLSVAESAVRTRRRVASKNSDRLDSEDAEFHTRVRDAYLAIAKAEPARFCVIDARGSVQQTHADVMNIVMPFLEARGLLGEKVQ
jgi:dTMP kinase